MAFVVTRNYMVGQMVGMVKVVTRWHMFRGGEEDGENGTKLNIVQVGAQIVHPANWLFYNYSTFRLILNGAPLSPILAGRVYIVLQKCYNVTVHCTVYTHFLR